MKKIFATLSMALSALALMSACGKSGGGGSSTVGVPNNCSTGGGYSNTYGCLTLSPSCPSNQGLSSTNVCANIDGYTGTNGNAYGYGNYGNGYGYGNYGNSYANGYSGYGGGYRPGSYGYANSYANGYYNGVYQNYGNGGYYGNGSSAYLNLSIW